MIATLARAGLEAVGEYIGLHVLTCLVPAFFLAGAVVSFVSRDVIIQYLGRRASPLVAFALASGASFLVAACSCTVIPVAGGLYFGGAGIGPAFIVLWVAPAANILALAYTGSILGRDLMIARLLSALLMAFVVGAVMMIVFRREERALGGDPPPDDRPLAGSVISRTDLVLVTLLVVNLLAPNYLVQQGPYGYKVLVWAATGAIVAAYAWRAKDRAALAAWLRETWFFVRIIFPLLLGGVFLVGVIGALLPPAWIEHWLGGASLRASFLATLIGAVSYFATMTEAPFVHRLLELGMGRGPALALLLTGPGLSLPNWLAIARVFGVRKALVYVPTIVVLGTLVGWAAGFVLGPGTF
jgi:uncharacterized membrane protein YraQ (UPF0718 family)